MLTNNNLHIVRIGYKTKTEVKQAVRKKRNKKLHGRVDGLYTRRSSHEEVFTRPLPW